MFQRHKTELLDEDPVPTDELHLRRSLWLEQIGAHFQPIIDTRTRHLLGFEALARWTRPGIDTVPARDFIRAAADAGLGRAVFDRTLRAAWMLAAWLPRVTSAPLTISVNIAAPELFDPQLPRHLERMMARLGSNNSSIALEVPESALQASHEDLAAAFLTFDELGFRFVIDDFGVSLTAGRALESLPVRSVKTSMLLAGGREGTGGLRRTISEAHALGLTPVVKCVESEEHLHFLQSLNVQGAQGYALGMPTPARQAFRLAEDSPSRVSSYARGPLELAMGVA